MLGLTPMPGDVDIVIASELMEAGRAVQRGFVTPDTTLHRLDQPRLRMTERIAMADGRVDSAALLSACRTAARQLIAFDMAALPPASLGVAALGSVAFTLMLFRPARTIGQ